MNKILITLILFTFCCISSFGQPQSSSHARKRIITYLNQLEKVGFSGAVLVELNGKKVISKGYGYSDRSKRQKNTPKTIFDIGSITKQFTAAAILKLEMQGKLTTNDNISLYFDGIPEGKARITIHDLMRHQSGLPGVVGGDYDKTTGTAFIESVIKAPLRFESGTKFSYSNIGYSLLAMIIEKVSDFTYEEYLYENLWKPAQMESTGYSRPNFNKNLVATGYDKNDKVWGKPTEKEWDKGSPYWHLMGNGGILSTTEDLYKWNLALFTNDILSSEGREKYYHPKLREKENDNPYYAYGWDVLETKRNTTLVQHNGTNGIFYSDFYRFLDERTTVIMLFNKAHSNFTETVLEISKIIYGPAYKPDIPIPDNEDNLKFTNEIINIALTRGLAVAKQDYNARPRKIDLLEAHLNSIGYGLLSENKIDQAIVIFEMSVFAFPQSANAFDSLGEAYMEAGNKELAINNYKKSLQLNPDNLNAAEMIKNLEN